MAFADASAYAQWLRSLGLTPVRAGMSLDIAITSPVHGFIWPCDWLEFDASGSLPAVRAAGSTLVGVSAPEGNHSFESSIQFGSTESFMEQFKHVRTEGGVEVYRDRSTGKQVYVGRTMAEEREAASSTADETRDPYREAMSLVEHDLRGGPRGALTGYFQRRRFKRALALLDECAADSPGSADVHFWTGKIHERLGDPRASLEAYDRALVAAPGTAYILKEASVAAFSLESYDTAFKLTETAARLEPEDADLRSNLAVSHLLRGSVDDALIEIRASSALAPDDQVTKLVSRFIEKVAGGAAPCPRNEGELQRALRDL